MLDKTRSALREYYAPCMALTAQLLGEGRVADEVAGWTAG